MQPQGIQKQITYVHILHNNDNFNNTKHKHLIQFWNFPSYYIVNFWACNITDMTRYLNITDKQTDKQSTLV